MVPVFAELAFQRSDQLPGRRLGKRAVDAVLAAAASSPHGSVIQLLDGHDVVFLREDRGVLRDPLPAALRRQHRLVAQARNYRDRHLPTISI